MLEAFGSRIIHAGPIGAGTTVKLVNNLTLASNQIAAIEALVLGVKAGLSVETLREVISSSSGASRGFDVLVEDAMTLRPGAAGGQHFSNWVTHSFQGRHPGPRNSLESSRCLCSLAPR